MMKRVFDIALVTASLPVVVPLAALVAIAILLTDGKPVLYWSSRVGRRNELFLMPKFRTMRRDTPPVATHLLPDPAIALTSIGRFLRSSSLDEIPQLYSVARGDMSIVGPRPALFNQYDLIALRSAHGVDEMTPGITGWAQVNGRDDLSIARKVDYDRVYLDHRTITLDLKIIWLTIVNVFARKGVHH